MVTTIFTDGGCRGNPGRSAAGVYIPSMDLKLGFPMEDTTNNVSEYTALVHALETAQRLGLLDLTIKADSELMVKQMNGVYMVRSAKIIPLWTRAKELERTFKFVEYIHVQRSMNAVADKIANLTMDVMANGYTGGGIRWGDLTNTDRQMEQLLEKELF